MENTGSLKTSDMGSLSSAERRKIQKPLVEKRRRERMNGCLEELKEILINREPKLRSRASKLEKADILELTVERMKNDLNTMDFQILSKAYEDGYMECLGATVKFLARSGSQASPYSAEIVRVNLLRDLQQRQAPTMANSSLGVGFLSDRPNVLTSGVPAKPQPCMSTPSMIQANLPCLGHSVKSLQLKSRPNYREFPLVESPTSHPRQTASASKSRFLPYVKPTPLRELNQNTGNSGRQARSGTDSNFSGSNQDSLPLLPSSSLAARNQQISKAVSPKAPKEEDVWRPF